MKKLSVIILILLFAVSCYDGSKDNVSLSEEMESNETAGNFDLNKPENPTDRRIIWNANLEFQVKNVDESTKDISNLCAKYEAFISRMNLSSTNYQISNNITIRV
ncbi:hypothetical protein INR75_14925 [Zunongwangia sp. SCSIO 43204]|uniref:hypothetical protein n=1 Tax=Zunongwangia sp. SCSIO 43204 TaxID=2779359 RepID=UPI001CA83C72|nr:hypothetical protein [Zunongwangia sp. SCSIO 43204]UAB83460.1 hypothetical protein INR75_14925 [Zunongwangia sp. SCSIO 43204]